MTQKLRKEAERFVRVNKCTPYVSLMRASWLIQKLLDCLDGEHGDCVKCIDDPDWTCPWCGDPDGCNNRELGEKVRKEANEMELLVEKEMKKKVGDEPEATDGTVAVRTEEEGGE